MANHTTTTLDEEAEVARIAQEAREREEAERAEREGNEAEMRAMEAELEAFEAANRPAKAKEPEPEPTQEQVDFWGDGYAYSMYNDLDRRYQKWIEGRGEVSNATSLLIKQIAIMEATIDRESAAGRSTEKYVKPLNDLLAALNLQPSQQESLGEFEAMPFGVGIRVYENRKPIPEPDPDFRDFDGIVRYISTCSLGTFARCYISRTAIPECTRMPLRSCALTGRNSTKKTTRICSTTFSEMTALAVVRNEAEEAERRRCVRSAAKTRDRKRLLRTSGHGRAIIVQTRTDLPRTSCILN